MFDKKVLFLTIACIATVALCELADGAPANSASTSNNKNTNNGSNGNQKSRLAIFSSLFRRGSGNESTSTQSSTADEESMTEPEKEAQKFLDTIPSTGEQNKEPSTFRERLGDTFGLLREGVSNQFKSWRENLSDTVEDLRDTWSNE